MPTTAQMLADYPDILLQVIAELRGAFLDAAENHQQAVELLAVQITDPTSILMAYQELVDYHPRAQEALDHLLAEGGEVAEAQFSREFGSIRQMGPARLARETPWHAPESVAELLYYYGFLGRGFRGAGSQAQTVVYLPSDVIPWLPKPAAEDTSALPLHPVPPPPASRMIPTESAFLEDMGTLLGFLHTEGMALTEAGEPEPRDLARLQERLQPGTGVVPHGVGDPTTVEAEMAQVRLALLLHLAKRLGWLRRDPEGRIRLTGNRVYAFLDQTRAEQRRTLWEAWCHSPEWNDLRRVPGLDCSQGNWRNDPLQARQAILDLMRGLQPGCWYSQAELIQAIKEMAPDFQRPPDGYTSWYVRDAATQEFLRGFEHWDRVEGALLRFLFAGPLYWLEAVDLAEPSAGDDLLISLSGWGAQWLGLDAEPPVDPPRRPLVVEEDFTVRVPLSTGLMDRFRVERFALWQASYPEYVYRITQRSLRRALEQGIPPSRVLAFLRRRARTLPPRVVRALERFEHRSPHRAARP